MSDEENYDYDEEDDLLEVDDDAMDLCVSEDDAAFYDDGLESVVEKETSNYRTLTPSELAAELEGTVQRVADLFEFPAPTVRLLLAHCKWNETRCIERLSEDETKLFQESGVPNPRETKKTGNKVAVGTVLECTICLSDFKFQESCRIACGHVFCTDCWSRYLEVKIMEGQVAKVTCAAKNCSAQLDSAAVAELLEAGGRAALLPRFHKHSLDAYVLTSSNLRWCPGKNCQNALRVDLLKEKEVQCGGCETRFCFGCGNLPHAPCDCEMMAQWMAKCAREGDDLKWLAQYTKECPKCKALIHKDGGCQYMACPTCQHKFCWMCLGAFDHKDHNCNKLAEEADPTTERAQLNKFIHFYSRYQTHQQSLDLEDKLMGVAEATMRELTEKGAAWIDVQYIKQATIALNEARQMLKYTYVYGYFLPAHVNRSIFEYLQGDLEKAVERLSGMLEANGDKDRLKVINAAEYVKQRQKNLLEGLLEGDIGGLGGKDVEQNYKNTVQKYDGWIYHAGR